MTTSRPERPERPKLWTRLTVLFDRLVGRPAYRLHRVLYLRSGGRIGHRTMAGTMLLLTTTGRKSGLPRTTPLLYLSHPTSDGTERFLVVGSNGGRPQVPAWVLNLGATPEAQVQVGRRHLSVRAEILNEEQRAALWPTMTAYYKGWRHYEELTDRPLQVVSLLPLS